MQRKFYQIIFVFIAACGLPGMLHAHPGHGLGFTSGLAHPLTGLDHLLAMIAVGVLAALQTRSDRMRIVVLPLIFTTGVFIGGVSAMFGLQWPAYFVEAAIAASVAIFGALILFTARRAQTMNGALNAAAIIGVLFFAVAHGQAHGQELPALANASQYAVGFVISTLLLHLAGVLIGGFAGTSARTLTAVRAAGGAMTVIGIGLLAGI